jgi:site-specific recombinase XerD
MTHLRQIMLEELRRRNYAESTIDAYIHTVEHFSRHFHRSPDQLGPEHIRQYQAALFTRWKLAPNTVTQRLAALRFFYVRVLKRGWSVAETPYPKKVLHLPQVLSQDEVARLIDAAEFPFHRILLMTLYATGARSAEVAHLKISNIDSQRMVIHIRGGKGRKDRDVMLQPQPARYPARLLARAEAQAHRLVVPRRSMTYSESSGLRQSSLARLSAGRPTRRP